jgi:hypothetical protein
MQWSFSLNNFGVHLSLQSWGWCLRCCSVVVSSKGMHKVEQKCTKKTPTKCPKFKCNTVSVSFSACRCSSVVFSSKVGREREKNSLETVLWMISAAVASLSTAVRLLLLEALFMQISGVSLALTWHHKLCLFRVLLCMSLCYKLSPFQAYWQSRHCTRFLRPACLFTAHVGSGSSPSSVEFSYLCHSHKCSCFCLLSPRSCSCRSLYGLPGLFMYHSRKDSLPLVFGGQCTPPFFPRVFKVLIAYYSVSLLSMGGGWSVQGAMLHWPRVVCGSTAVPLSSPCPCLSKLSGCGWLAAQVSSWFLCLT